jgi:hypothetical protein
MCRQLIVRPLTCLALSDAFGTPSERGSDRGRIPAERAGRLRYRRRDIYAGRAASVSLIEPDENPDASNREAQTRQDGLLVASERGRVLIVGI